MDEGLLSSGFRLQISGFGFRDHRSIHAAVVEQDNQPVSLSLVFGFRIKKIHYMGRRETFEW